MKLSIVFPVFNEEESLQTLIERLNSFLSLFKGNYEVIFVDDHSIDKTPLILKAICEKYDNYSYLRLSKNSGSHVAIIAGLSRSTGDCSVFLASDLQDPPELIELMIEKWKDGNHIVWAVRESIKGISFTKHFLSKLFYKVINYSTSVKLAPTGADFALLDRKALNALLSSVGSNPSLGSLLASLGFKQIEIKYVKEARKYGKSNWSLSKKIHAFIDAIVGFSFLPMRIMSYFGFFMALLGFIYASVVILLKVISGKQIEGWASIMVVILIIGGIQMIMLGILGEYLWRNLEEARKKPIFFIEESSNIGLR